MGGALADAIDPRRLKVICEAVLGVGPAIRRHAPGYPLASLLLTAAALLAVINGVHRPALEALTALLVPKCEMTAAATFSARAACRASSGRAASLPACAGCPAFRG